MDDIRTTLYEKTGGFLKGICHPGIDGAPLLEAGIHWVRWDAPYPFDMEGNRSARHLRSLEQTRNYANIGLRSVIISPYPKEFLRHGIDPRTEEGLENVREVCEFLAREYRGLGVCWQATNEMFVIPFRAPLTIAESMEFLIASLQGLRRGDPDAALGHNTVSIGEGWDELGHEILARTDCDYLGFDLYNGTWGPGGTDTYIDRITQLYELYKMPVILMEFGFASLGGNAHADSREVLDYLKSLGFDGMDDLKNRMDEFIETLPPPLKHTAVTCAPEDRLNAIVGMMPHLTKLWFAEMTIPHTEEGQAAFYAEILPKLLADKRLAGAVIYCWQDSKTCFTCGAEDCPCETAWGITRCDGTRKPAYDTIKSIFGGNSSCL